MKKFIKILMAAALCLSLGLGIFAACGEKSSVGAAKIAVDGSDYTVEVGDNIEIPDARLVDSAGNVVEGVIDISVVNPKNVVVATSDVNVPAKIIGDYKITYSHSGVEDFVITVSSVDSKGPVLSLDNTFGNLYKDRAVVLPNIEMDDFSEIDMNNAVIAVYYVNGEERVEKNINSLTNTFIADQTGEYVYHAEISDVIGNKTTQEWKMVVTDKTWTADDATGKTIASFDESGYTNVFGAGTVTDRQGNPDFEILDEYEGETGVAKVTMNYFDHNFGYYSSFNLRFPREYKYTEGKRLAVKLRVEDITAENGTVNLFAYEHTHEIGVGVTLLGSYPMLEGEWTTLIIEGGALSALQDAEGYIRGIQLDVKQSSNMPDAQSQIIYIASVTEIETLSVPENLRIEDDRLAWDAVDGASGYNVNVNGVDEFSVNNWFDIPKGAYTVKVMAVGDGAYYENSEYSGEIGNTLKAPAGLTVDSEGVISWTAVENASGYLVDVDGETFDVDSGVSYQFTGSKDRNYVIKVKAKGDGEVWFDSAFSGIAVRYVPQPDGYIADFGDETFVYDVVELNAANLIAIPAAAESFSAEYLSEYEGAEGVLKINMVTGGSAAGWGAVSLKLPEALALDETLISISIKFRVEGVPGGEYAGLRVYGLGADGQARDLSPAETFGMSGIDAWFTANINREKILAAFNNSASSQYLIFGIANVPAYTNFDIYLDEITCVRIDKLAAPANVELNGNTLTWDAVTNATGYVVEINGEEFETDTESYTLSAADQAYTIKVKAVADGYLDSDYSQEITNILPVPEGLKYENGSLSWQTVEGVEDYILSINGEETTVSGATSYEFTPAADTNYVIKVKAASTGAWYESPFDKGIAIRGKAQPEGYIADFSDGTFAYDVVDVNAYNLIDAGAAGTEYSAEYLAEYDGADDVLKIVMLGNNGSPNWAAVSLKLPEVLSLDVSLQSITVKFRVEGSNTLTDGLRIYGYGSDGAARELISSTESLGGIDAWYTATFNRAKIDFAFNNSASSQYMVFAVANAPKDTVVTLYLDEITCVRYEKLGTPLNLALNGNTLTWDAVNNATGYKVNVNGEEFDATTNSYTLAAASEAYAIKVKAVADGYLDSDYSQEITNILPVPEGLKYENGSLSWQTVEGVEDYILSINGEETTVSGATSYEFTPAADTNYVIKVKAASTGAWYESPFDKGIAIRGKAQPEGYIADFSDGTFAYDVVDVKASNLAAMAAEDYYAEYLAGYEGAEGVLKIELHPQQTAPYWAVVSLKLPEILSLDESLQSVTVKIRMEAAASLTDGVRIYSQDVNGEGRELLNSVQGINAVGAWYEAVFDKAKIDEAFMGASSTQYISLGVANVPAGTVVTLYLDEITCERITVEPSPETVVADFASADSKSSVEACNISNIANIAGTTEFSVFHMENYQGQDGVLKIDMTVNDTTWAAVSLKIDQPFAIDSSLKSLKVNFRIEGLTGGPYAGLRMYGYRVVGEGLTDGQELSPATTFESLGIDSWYTATIDKAKIDSGFGGATSGEYITFGVGGIPAGTTFSLYLDSISIVTE